MQLTSIVSRARRAGRAAIGRLRYGGPQGIVRTADLAARKPELWHPAFPAHAVERRAPRQFGATPARFDLPAAPHPALGVLELPGGSVLGANGWVVTADGFVVADCAWYGSALGTEARLPFAFTRRTKIAGTCLSLATDFAGGNYGHFVLDCLSRFAIFQQAGLDIATVDCVYMPAPVSPTARLVLQEVGIPLNKCRWADAHEMIQAERLLVTSFPGRRRDYAPWIPRWLQRTLMPSGQSHRIYVPREGVRRIVNEAELMLIASRYGFQPFDFRMCAHEPSFFHAAQAVIGAHGAGLTNLAFCQPGTKVLELIPSDHVHPYFYSLSDAAGLDYAYLVGNSVRQRPANARGPSPYDFTVDPAAFAVALQAWFGPA